MLNISMVILNGCSFEMVQLLYTFLRYIVVKQKQLGTSTIGDMILISFAQWW